VLAHLAKAGKWALDVATDIGTKVAVAAISHWRDPGWNAATSGSVI
jgi:hypothetical protein